MCGRFFIDLEDEEVESIVMAAALRLQEKYPDADAVHIASGEIFPTNVVPVFIIERGALTPVAMRWGFPAVPRDQPGHGGKPLRIMVPYTGEGEKKPVAVFNTKVETALKGPEDSATIASLARQALHARRVALPTSGFFEWTHPKDKKAVKDKYRFLMPGSRVLYLAGIYSVMAFGDLRFPHVSILTTRANEGMQPIHDRMPVLLRPEEVTGWIAGTKAREIVTRMPFALDMEKTA